MHYLKRCSISFLIGRKRSAQLNYNSTKKNEETRLFFVCNFIYDILSADVSCSEGLKDFDRYSEYDRVGLI